VTEPNAGFDAEKPSVDELIAAVLAYDLEGVEDLLLRGVDVNAKDSKGFPALMWVVDNGYTEVAQLLIDNGAHIDAKDESGDTTLMLAAKVGHVGLVDVLIKNGANIDEKNNDGITALDYAIDMTQTEITQRLQQAAEEVAAEKERARRAVVDKKQQGLRDKARYKPKPRGQS